MIIYPTVPVFGETSMNCSSATFCCFDHWLEFNLGPVTTISIASDFLLIFPFFLLEMGACFLHIYSEIVAPVER